MVDGKCWECKFYNKTGRGHGECRRMPPPWRFVDAGDWCGEFLSNNSVQADAGNSAASSGGVHASSEPTS